jgi:hypothetical protein
MTGGLVGRGAFLAAAMTSVDAAFAGSGGLLLLSGEPGIGKTALLGGSRRTSAAWHVLGGRRRPPLLAVDTGAACTRGRRARAR